MAAISTEPDLNETSCKKDFNLPLIKRDLLYATKQCQEMGLLQSAKWCAELSYSLQTTKPAPPVQIEEDPQDFLEEFDKYTLAKTFFDLREYERAAFFVDGCQSNKAFFLHMYANYLAGEKKKYDDLTDLIGPIQFKTIQNGSLKALRRDLEKRYNEGQCDGYALYLYGVVLKKLELLKPAKTVLVEALHKAPLHWGAWIELAGLVTDWEKLTSLNLPDHWMKEFFLAYTCVELQLNEEALKRYTALSEAGFQKSTFIISQIANGHHIIRTLDVAVELFSQLQKVDPYRLENMDTYSNLLYVKEMKAELSHLAHQVCEVDKYRVETCCVIGNYYSLRGQHEKAVLYFQRCLKLNPHYLSAWTLMGHEYMQMKNTPAATEAYRQAIEVNKRDFRAWYGLGQTYDILRMPFYSLYYYRQAQQVRPNDSRMLVALGESYERLDKIAEAKKCYWRAYSVGDVEGVALVKLARLHEKFNEEEKAASFYSKYVEQMETRGTADTEDHCQAYRYLARYHLKQNNFDEATNYAHKCCDHSETREEGKAILKEISTRRPSGETPHPSTHPSGLETDVGSITQGQNQISRTAGDVAGDILNRVTPMNLTFTP
nr:cell division cycle protein 23 homolog [Lytechinus pictus]